jgi:hypothetical protein
LISPLAWPVAESVAQEGGGHLATVRNSAEQSWLWSTFNSYEGTPRSFWIGFHDTDPTVNSSTLQGRRAEYAWSSDEPVTYSNWDTLQPDTGGTLPSQSSVTMWNQVGGSWDNDFPNVAHRSVVELVPPAYPDILIGLRDVGAAFGSTARLTVLATGNQPLQFQWEFNGTDLPQRTSATLILTPIRLSHEGAYSVRVWNSEGEARAGPVMLRVGSPVQFIPSGSIWSFWDEGVSPPPDWRGANFNDANWDSGRAQFGYGDGDETTTVGYGPSAQNKYVTTWFRTRFVVVNPSLISGLTARLTMDDGAIGYLNGSEIFRANMTSGFVGPGTFALDQTTGTFETTPWTHEIDAQALVAGSNVLAVEVHQSDPASSDLSFDLQLQAVESLPPLRIRALDADQLELQWLATMAPVLLEKTAALETGWDPVTGEITESAGVRRITLNREGTTQFYRLRRP